MAKRKIRDEQDARWCLASVEAAGVTRAEWARKHGVDGRSLRAWAKKLSSRDKPQEPSPPEKADGMVELVPDTSHAPSRYVIRCSPFAVEVDRHFDDATLTRLLRVMAAC